MPAAVDLPWHRARDIRDAVGMHVRSVRCWGEVVWSGEYVRLGVWALKVYGTFKVCLISLLRQLSLSFCQHGCYGAAPTQGQRSLGNDQGDLVQRERQERGGRHTGLTEG